MKFPKGNIAKYFIYKKIRNSLIKSKNKVKIVDMGCGDATQWDWLYSSSFKNKVEFYGFDIDEKGIKKAQKEKSDWYFFNEPAYNMENYVNNVDIVTSLSALEHVYKRFEFLKSAKMIMKRGGDVLFEL